MCQCTLIKKGMWRRPRERDMRNAERQPTTNKKRQKGQYILLMWSRWRRRADGGGAQFEFRGAISNRSTYTPRSIYNNQKTPPSQPAREDPPHQITMMTFSYFICDD